MILIRPATSEDASSLGLVQVRAWRAGYDDLMPRTYLESLDPDERAVFWRDLLSREPDGRHVLVAHERQRVIGFATFGAEDTPAPTGRGELYAFNLDPDRWGSGAAGLFLEVAQAGLVADGYAEAVLWVMPGNLRGRRFYERHRWQAETVERTAEVFGITVPLLRYRRVLP